MKLFSRLRGRCYCAFCKAERKVYIKKHIDLTNVVGAVLLAMAVGQAYWGAPDPRALVLFCLTIVTLEVFVYMRWRASIICSLCGFDPLVYKKSPARASLLVQAFYKEQHNNPEFWLSRSPLVERRRQVRAQERKVAGQKDMLARNDARRARAAAPAMAPAAMPLPPKAAKTSSLAAPKGP